MQIRIEKNENNRNKKPESDWINTKKKTVFQLWDAFVSNRGNCAKLKQQASFTIILKL